MRVEINIIKKIYMGATKNAKRQYKGIFNRCRKKRIFLMRLKLYL